MRATEVLGLSSWLLVIAFKTDVSDAGSATRLEETFGLSLEAGKAGLLWTSQAVLDSFPPNTYSQVPLGEKTAVGKSWLLTQCLLNLHIALD